MKADRKRQAQGNGLTTLRVLTGQVSPSLFRFGCLNIGLDVHVMVDDDPPLASGLCHHLQKTSAKAAFRVKVKIGRRAALEARNPCQSFADGNVRREEPQRLDLELKDRASERSFENRLVPIAECLLPGKKHSIDVRKGPISREVLRISITVALVPSGDLVVEDLANGTFVGLRLRRCVHKIQCAGELKFVGFEA